MDQNGEYTLLDGDFNASNVYFGSLITTSGGLFRQQGGRINTGLKVYAGTYQLEGGYLYGDLIVPPSDGISGAGGGGTVIQTGGTNYASVQVGYLAGRGIYVLSNGVSRAPGMLLGARGQVRQGAAPKASPGP